MRSVRLLLVLLCLIPVRSIAADLPAIPLYVSGFIERESLSLEGGKVRPMVTAASLGVWLFRGVGAELELATGLRDDSFHDLEFDVSSQLSLSLRFESPSVSGVAAYALLGVTRSSFETSFSTIDGSDDKHSFRGFRGVFGLVLPLTQRLALDAAFSRHEYDDDIGVNSFRVGVRYTLNDIEPRELRGWLR